MTKPKAPEDLKKWPTLEETFEKFTIPEPNSGCLLWIAAVTRNGYGRVNVSRGVGRPRVATASRVAWEMAYGAIPRGLSVLHRCDNPPCVRPDHLFLGTQRDNIRDAARKGRLGGCCARRRA